ncbi:MAG: transcriptional regulator [Acidobacteria bacterium]|nr:transcriptional regulator [Acidobacteriota bacterium]
METPPPPPTRFRFGAFTLSPSQRTLSRDGAEIPLIPRYFDLLVLLVARRGAAVSRDAILDAAWSDVVVSDGALSQAIRTLRRALGDDPREPAFIRTLPRHGYRFVHPDVVEEAETGPAPRVPARAAPAAETDPFAPELQRLLAPTASTRAEREQEQRAAAEALHSLGTAEALRRLDAMRGGPGGRALLRDARWDVVGAGAVPILGSPAAGRTILALVGMRLGRAARLASARWGAAAGGGAASGLVAGLGGAAAMRFSPDSTASQALPVTLALVGAIVGGLGAAGVGAGLAVAEAVARSFRGAALAAFGALGGGAVGFGAHLIGRATLEGLFGHDLAATGGGFEGLVIGGAAGLGYAISTPRPGGGGMATPRGAGRLRAAAITGACCALGGVALTLAGGHLSGTSLDFMARSFDGSQVGIAPLAHLLGERDVGPWTRTVLAVYEGFLFGAGLVLGLTRRPRLPE